MKKQPLLLILILTIFIISCSENQTPSLTSSAVQENSQASLNLEGPFLVIRIIDGDTIIINTSEHVRLSGIDTPETGECYYQEAKQFLFAIAINKEVYLEQDITNKDKYDRLLRYIYRNGTFVNGILVEQGYAKVFDAYKDETRRYLQLKRLEDTAITNQLGLWKCPPKNCLYVGSKNSDKYYPPECRIARRIKPENQLCFTSEAQVRNRTQGKC